MIGVIVSVVRFPYYFYTWRQKWMDRTLLIGISGTIFSSKIIGDILQLIIFKESLQTKMHRNYEGRFPTLEIIAKNMCICMFIYLFI